MTGHILAVHHDFIWYNPATWISALIRVLDDCWANHSAIAVWLEGRLFVMEARASGMVLSSFAEWLKHRPKKKFYIGKPKFELPADLNARILEKAGVKYDLIGLLFWHPMRLLFGKWWGGTSTKGRFVCSELVGYIYREQFPDWRHITTGDIMRSGKVEWLIKV